ncbi:MAG: hypothetical protein A2Y77_10215 [Planctomycetes bacterium RBG_13_62_9]|nr:MAG: hypothetical protein A2Y77_10215 [Planctomycetes bacterium RBG_13_62_9]
MDNLRIVNESLTGARGVDEQTCASVAILADRLERLKQSSSLFAEIGFSPHVKKLTRQAEPMVAGRYGR